MAGKKYQIDVFCNGCRTQLFQYLKDGEGHLVKCYADGIIKDFTQDRLHCPECHEQFARPWAIHGKPAYKIVQGKVFVRR
jgi:hypothetical protein